LQPIYDNPARHPERLAPLIGHGIIIGPDQRHALVLGTFAPAASCSPDWLSQLAAWLGQVYSGSAGDVPAHQELHALLRDDNYRPDRRRRVPAAYAGGHELYLFDVELNPSESFVSPNGTPLFAFAAEPGEKGEIAALPWYVVQDAVRVAAG
jgi:hypothetical protein